MRAYNSKRMKILSSGLLTLSCAILAALTACSGIREAREIKKAPMPTRYIETKSKDQSVSEGSLWADRATLFEDAKARRVNDLLTILITETTAASKTAATNASRDSSGSYSLTNLLGMKVQTRVS